MPRSHDKVTPSPTTFEAIKASREFWIRRYAEASLAKAIAKLRCEQLGIDTSEVEINPEQLRMDLI